MKTIEHDFDFVVVGGGLAGICAAVTAARLGVRTALVQDRPVLGGNASTEIRVPPVGASGCNFAYSRETGLIEELLLNNLFRNPTKSQEGWNLEIESLVRNEPLIELFLNCAVSDAATNNQKDRIESVKAYCAMAETWHIFRAKYFADCSGDGIVGAQAGAVYRVGVEARSEFDEPMCPEHATRETMGMSLHLHARNAGQPIPFSPPAWIKMELNEDDFGPYRPVCENFFPDTGGFWWLEWGGNLDGIHDTLKIKDEVQRITLAVWDYLKNRSPLAEKLTTYELDWMGAVPGKRESRRFEGEHILTMNDIDQQVQFEDSVAYGGWGFDDHPPDGFYAKESPSTHQYLRGPHNVPLRSLYSRNIGNLFFAGRNVSATHYALSNIRVMLTCAQLGEAAGVAAAHAVRRATDPRHLTRGEKIQAIQHDLALVDHHIHALPIRHPADIAPEAAVTASSTFSDSAERPSWGIDVLSDDRMLQLAIATPSVQTLRLLVDAKQATRLGYRFHDGPANQSTYPDRQLMHGTVDVPAGTMQWVNLPIHCDTPRPGWHFLILNANPDLAVHVSETPPGTRWFYPRPADPIRPNPFSEWTSRSLQIGTRRAADADGAMVTAPQWNDFAQSHRDISGFLHFGYLSQVQPPQPVFTAATVINGHARPTNLPNLWVSQATDFRKPESIRLDWPTPQTVSAVQVLFDSSLHFHFYQSWQGYPVNAIPSIVRDYRIVATTRSGASITLAEVTGNIYRNRHHTLAEPIAEVTSIKLEVLGTHGVPRAQVYSIRVFNRHARSAGLPSRPT